MFIKNKALLIDWMNWRFGYDYSYVSVKWIEDLRKSSGSRENGHLYEIVLKRESGPVARLSQFYPGPNVEPEVDVNRFTEIMENGLGGLK